MKFFIYTIICFIVLSACGYFLIQRFEQAPTSSDITGEYISSEPWPEDIKLEELLDPYFLFTNDYMTVHMQGYHRDEALQFIELEFEVTNHLASVLQLGFTDATINEVPFGQTDLSIRQLEPNETASLTITFRVSEGHLSHLEGQIKGLWRMRNAETTEESVEKVLFSI